ncbi:TlpA family protein disulfide reductase [Nocardioides rubriscoriae]|uniref:TlpA family protein disulfide reductase n=1 Tax=Nocardioides rubriscoriae TaxID=642762 RepID=UPI001B861B5E|nr:redoxin family protein [Nocardioides rubriscoriae]
MTPPSPRRRARTRAALATSLTVLVLAGCGTSSEAGSSVPSPAVQASSTDGPATTDPDLDTGSAPSAGPSSPAAADPAPVPEALQFEATTVAGDTFDGASVAGRPVVLWFWAPWCAVCKSQAPEVTQLAETYGDQVAFVGVGSLSDSDAIKTFADDVPGPTQLSDPDGALYQRFGISEQSSFVVLDADGQEVLRTGYADDDALADTVADLAG